MSLTPHPESTNPFFQDLAVLMRTENFRQFYKEHMHNALELKSTIVYIELYRTIETVFQQFTGNAITDAEMELLLKECMRRKEYRQPFTSLIQAYLTKDLKEMLLQLEELPGRIKKI